MKTFPLQIIFVLFIIIFAFFYIFSGKIQENRDLVYHLNSPKIIDDNLFNFSNYNYAFAFGKSNTLNLLSLKNSEFYFDGIDDYIVIPDNDKLSPSTSQAFTISFWINFHKNDFSPKGSKSYIQFLGKASPGNYEFSFRQFNNSNSENKNNRISFYLFNLSGGLGSGSFIQPIELKKWLFITAVYNGTHVSIWKDGVLKDTDALSDYGIQTGNGKAPIIIGTLDGKNYFQGKIKDLRIYNKALDAKEINYLFSHNDYYDVEL